MRIALMGFLGLVMFVGLTMGVAILVQSQQMQNVGAPLREIESLIVLLIGVVAAAGLAAGAKK